MTATTTTYDWLRQIPSSLLQKDSTPLVGFPPPFPWKPLSAALAQVFQLPNLTIKPTDALRWRTEKELLDGLGEQPAPLHIAIAPTGGTVCWLMAQKDLAFLMCLLLTQKEQPLEVIDPEFLESFYQFLAIEALNSLYHLDFDKELSGQILAKKEIPTETSLCQDVEIIIGDRTVCTRLIISPELQLGWKQRYSERTMDAALLSALDLTIHLEVGRIAFSSEAWSKICPGDFILMDFCSLKSSGEGRVLLTVQGTPLFRGKLKAGNIKILEHPLYNEVEMTANNSSDDEETKDTHADGDADAFTEDSENEPMEGEEEPQEKWPPPPESRTAQQQQAQANAQVTPAPAASQVIKEQVATPEVPEEGFSLGGTPLSIVIEIGRLQMTIQKLMEIQPGNLLELNVRPENGVDLVVNGKRIAKGELLLIGESLGVRVLDIGSKKHE